MLDKGPDINPGINTFMEKFLKASDVEQKNCESTISCSFELFFEINLDC